MSSVVQCRAFRISAKPVSRIVQTRAVPKIGTHDGVFHCDEVLGTWMLKKTKRFENAEVIRTRDLSKLEEADVVLDVGGVYDPEKLRFDHHNGDYNEVFENRKIKLSSAGLIYRHFGKEVLRTILHPAELSENELDAVYNRLYEQVIEAIDGVDNGVSNCFKSQVNYQDKTNLISRVGMLNPTWQDLNENGSMSVSADERFTEAMELCGNEFTMFAKHMVKNWLPARDYVRAALQDRFSVSSTGRIILLETSCPWKDHLLRLEAELSITDKIYFCVHSGDDLWYVQSVPLGISTFRTRAKLPFQWRGLKGDELDVVSGTAGTVFVHQLGYIGAHKSKEGAIELARKALLFS